MTTPVLNTKLGEVEEKIPDHAKYIITQKLFKLTAENVRARFKQANLVSRTDYDKKLIGFFRNITSNKTKYLEVQVKLNSLTIKDYNFFFYRIYFISNDGSQNTFIHQPTFDTLELKQDKGTDYVLSWKSKGVCNSKIRPFYSAFLHSIKLYKYRMEIKFDKDPLAVEENNYLTKIVMFYIVYDLDTWSRILLAISNLKIACLEQLL